MPDIIEQVKKGGEVYLELSINRCADGLELWVKAQDKIESFMKASSDMKADEVSSYGNGWIPVAEQPLRVYKLERAFALNGDYSFSEPGSPLTVREDGERVNLSFLRLVGISDPQGIRFRVKGPFSREFIKRLSNDILTETRNFVREFIVPVHINLRISSQEV